MDDVLFILGIACFSSGIIYYNVIYRRYRNADKRHHHENETKSAVDGMQKHDTLKQHRTRLSNSTMVGRNENRVEGALSKGAGAAIKTKLAQNGTTQSGK